MIVRERRRVALLIETSQERGRAIIRGIIRYANLYGLWDFRITPSNEKQQASSLSKWNGDGIIARVLNDELATSLLEKNLPLILLGHRVHSRNGSRVTALTIISVWRMRS
ncbi:MAG: hypothetical protein Q4G68_01265 [Planctomycetia bacterium]|nr:hypothetical protein [Planctomycetia bacterium]